MRSEINKNLPSGQNLDSSLRSEINKGEVRIPTLLGLGVLLIGIGVGVLLVNGREIFQSQAAPSLAPQNIQVTNIANTHVSISWQTDTATAGFIQAGTSNNTDQSFKDDRDQNLPQKHVLHFVTLTNLAPNTTYYYKIVSDTFTYPAGSPYSFKTTAQETTNTYPALIGQILNGNRQPVSEALVSLHLNGQNLAAITKVAGNFILPLVNVTIPGTNINASLIISDGTTTSVEKILLPKSDPFPPFTLGKNEDFTIIATPSASLSPTATPSATPTEQPKPALRGDLNGDGLVNFLDRVILVQNFGTKPRNKQSEAVFKAADLNGDGIVDQKDLNILTQIILQNSSK